MLHYIRKSTLNIKNGADRTSEIIKGLQSFSRIDKTKQVEVDISENIENTLLMLKNQYKDKILIIREYNPVPKISCFPSKLNQVFLNIISNSIYSISEKGKIKISLKTCIRKKGQYVQICIEDNGKGMTKEVKGKIFERFFTTKEVGKGTGLGLSITHGIIKEHDGFIEVESELKKGAIFCIYLPIY